MNTALQAAFGELFLDLSAAIGAVPLANLRLKFVERYRDRHGKLRHYFRRSGRKLVALPGLPGSTEFMEAYAAALAGDTGLPNLDGG